MKKNIEKMLYHLQLQGQMEYREDGARDALPWFFGTVAIAKYPAMLVTNEDSLSQHR